MNNSLKLIKRFGLLAVVVLLALIILPNCFATVPVGSTGIMLTMGKVEDAALSEGVHFKMPFVQRIVSMDNRVKKLELSTWVPAANTTVPAVVTVSLPASRARTSAAVSVTGTAASGASVSTGGSVSAGGAVLTSGSVSAGGAVSSEASVSSVGWFVSGASGIVGASVVSGIFGASALT